MAFSCAVIDLAAFGIEIDGERLFEMDGDLRAGLDIDGGEGLAVQLVHPIGHVPHATGQDATYGFVAGNADAADGTVCAHVGHLAAVAVDKRVHARTPRGDALLRNEVLLGAAAPLSPDPRDVRGWKTQR